MQVRDVAKSASVLYRIGKLLVGLLFVLTSLPQLCRAQSDDSSALIVEGLRCRGNTVTSCPFILGYVRLSAGAPLNEDEIQNAKLRLSSLPGYISIDIHLEKGTAKGRVLVVIDVVEADRVENEFTTGTSSRLSGTSQVFEGRLTDHDVLGTHDTVNLDVQGIAPISGLTQEGVYARLQVADPKLFDSSRYFFIGGMTYQNTKTVYPTGDLFYFYSNVDITDQLGIDFSVGRRLFDNSYVTIGYLQRIIAQSETHFLGKAGAFSTDTNPNPDKGLAVGYGWNSEDNPNFPTLGSRLNISVGDGWGNIRFRKTWSSSPESTWTLQLGGTPGTQYRESLDEAQDFSIAYGRAISATDWLGGIRRGRWYIEPGISYYTSSEIGRNLVEYGVKAGLRLEMKAFGVVEFYAIATRYRQVGSTP